MKAKDLAEILLKDPELEVILENEEMGLVIKGLFSKANDYSFNKTKAFSLTTCRRIRRSYLNLVKGEVVSHKSRDVIFND
jgi:hypothetical protein